MIPARSSLSKAKIFFQAFLTRWAALLMIIFKWKWFHMKNNLINFIWKFTKAFIFTHTVDTIQNLTFNWKTNLYRIFYRVHYNIREVGNLRAFQFHSCPGNGAKNTSLKLVRDNIAHFTSWSFCRWAFKSFKWREVSTCSAETVKFENLSICAVQNLI